MQFDQLQRLHHVHLSEFLLELSVNLFEYSRHLQVM